MTVGDILKHISGIGELFKFHSLFRHISQIVVPVPLYSPPPTSPATAPSSYTRPLSEVLHQHVFCALLNQEKYLAPFELHDDLQLSTSGCLLSMPFETPVTSLPW